MDGICYYCKQQKNEPQLHYSKAIMSSLCVASMNGGVSSWCVRWTLLWLTQPSKNRMKNVETQKSVLLLILCFCVAMQHYMEYVEVDASIAMRCIGSHCYELSFFSQLREKQNTWKLMETQQQQKIENFYAHTKYEFDVFSRCIHWW